MISVKELARALGLELPGAGGAVASDAAEINQVSSIAAATPGSLVFAEDAASFEAASKSAATAVLASPQAAEGGEKGTGFILLSAQPRLAFARAAKLLAASATTGETGGVHPAAVVSGEAHLAEGVSVGACAVIDAETRIGKETMIGSGAIVGRGAVIGEACRIYPRVVIYPGTTLGDRVTVHAGAVLGGDGFGYVRDRTTGEYLQFPQQGKLVIEDDVEIGANATVDRGALEETRIGRGSKIDNLVHIGHNVRLGANVVIAAQTGISGSSGVGDNAVLGGQVGIGDHAFVGEGVILGGQAGILPHKSLQGSGELFWGTPAQPVKQYLRQLGAIARLPRSGRGRGDRVRDRQGGSSSDQPDLPKDSAS